MTESKTKSQPTEDEIFDEIARESMEKNKELLKRLAEL